MKSKTIYIAKDADNKLIQHIKPCKEKNIEIVYVDTMKELGELWY